MAVKKKYPKSFYDDGLGDFLEWIDDEVLVHSERKTLARDASADDDASDNGVDSKGGKAKKGKLKKKAANTKGLEVSKKKREKSLYGDNDLSELIYKPPKRQRFQLGLEEGEQEVDKKLEDKARGLINRLAAQTMPYVTTEFEKLLASNSRSAINACIFSNIESSILNKLALTKRKLVAELMLLVSYLSHKIHQDIGASLTHRLISRFETLYSSHTDDQDKTLDNIILCLVNLYIIGLLSAHVIYELTKRICSADFKPKSIELLLLIIKSCGFQLRKDNPLLMKNLITMAQSESQNLKDKVELGSRIEFMMEALAAIKNNNTSKIGNYGCDIDRDTIESVLKSLIKRTKLPESLSDASYDEILSSPNFYLLEFRVEEDNEDKAKQPSRGGLNVSKLDDRVSKALGLKKPTEKAILSALLRASDYVEASNSIIGFGLNHCSDAMLVCLQIAIHEKKFNQFHVNLINNLCKFNRRYKIAVKFAIQDKIRALGGMELERVKMFKELCFELIKLDAIPITILKSIEWADLSQSTREFLTFLFEGISGLGDDDLRRKIMSKVDKKSSFAGAMRTFTNCFLKGCRLFG